MPKAKPKCPKCGESMEEGYLAAPFMTQPRQIQIWVKGRPLTPADFSIKSKGAKPRVVTITSWRCTGCGYLESYSN